MRYEAKHKYFKQLANTIGNFINLPYTLAMRHQFLQCYLRLGVNQPQPLETGKGMYTHDHVIEVLLLKFSLPAGVDMSISDLPHLTQFRGAEIYW